MSFPSIKPFRISKAIINFSSQASLQSILALLILGLLNGCASKPPTTEYAEDKVVARSDERTSRPSWAKETKLIYEEDGHWIILGVAEVPGDSRAQAAFKMSDAQARGNLSSKLETSITKIVESSDSGLSMDDQSLKALVREVSQTSLKNVDIDERYWEKVAQTNSNGEKKLVMKAFSRLKVSKQNFSAMAAAQTDKSKLATPEMKNKIETLIEKNLANQFGIEQ